MRYLKRFVTVVLALLMLLAPAGLAKDLSLGSQGDEVWELQWKLNSLGYRVGTLDGSFGGTTEVALRDFQHDNDLPETGALDETTRTRLYADGTGDFPAPQGAFAIRNAAAPVDASAHGYFYYIDDCGWEEANRRAIELGGHLVSIDSLNEYAELQSEILELGCSDVAFWIGAHRDHHLGHSGKDFYWMDDDGIPYLEPINFERDLGGLNPWALGKPRYRNDAGEPLYYVHLRYNAGELRWIWEDTLGQPEADARTGYIVELSDVDSLSGLTTLEAEAAKPILEENPAPAESVPGAGYKLELLGMEGKSVLARATTEQPCQITCVFWDADHQEELFRISDYVEGGLNDRLVRVCIWPEWQYDRLPKRFIIEGALNHYDSATQATEYFTEWVTCDRYRTGEVDETPVRPERKRRHDSEEPAAWRVTPVLASDPAKRDENVKIEIYDENGNLIAMVNQGDPVYLPAGNYTAKMPGNAEADVSFTVTDGPVIPRLEDLPRHTVAGHVVNPETGTTIANMPITLEVQGETYTATTDLEGAYSFENIPEADARLSVGNHEGSVFNPTVTDFHVTEDSQDTELSVQPMQFVVFYGYLNEGAYEAEEPWYEFIQACDSGAYGPAEYSYTLLARSLYVTVEESDTSMGSPIPKGTIYDLRCETKLQNTQMSKDLLLSNNNFLAKYGLADENFIDYDNVIGKLFRFKGYVHSDNMKEDTPYYDDWFTGWSDQVLEIMSIEPVS